jgi:hypothetical protein
MVLAETTPAVHERVLWAVLWWGEALWFDRGELLQKHPISFVTMISSKHRDGSDK